MVCSYGGTYFDGKRQGTGVYRYAGGDGELGGIYLGEWMKGSCAGLGVLTYADGESYTGSWLDDKKDGLGVSSSASGNAAVIVQRVLTEKMLLLSSRNCTPFADLTQMGTDQTGVHMGFRSWRDSWGQI